MIDPLTNLVHDEEVEGALDRIADANLKLRQKGAEVQDALDPVTSGAEVQDALDRIASASLRLRQAGAAADATLAAFWKALIAAGASAAASVSLSRCGRDVVSGGASGTASPSRCGRDRDADQGSGSGASGTASPSRCGGAVDRSSARPAGVYATPNPLKDWSIGWSPSDNGLYAQSPEGARTSLLTNTPILIRVAALKYLPKLAQEIAKRMEEITTQFEKGGR